MEEDVLMSSIKEGEWICDNKEAQKQFQFALTFGTKIKTEFINESILTPPHFQVQLEYKLSDEYKFISAQDQWYFYSQQHMSRRIFYYPHSKNIIIFQASVGSGMKSRKYPQLIIKKLPEYVKSEYHIFCFSWSWWFTLNAGRAIGIC